MDIESFVQFADENNLYFKHSFMDGLKSLKLVFTNAETRHSYTYYVGRSELSDTSNHNIIINKIKKLVTENLL